MEAPRNTGASPWDVPPPPNEKRTSRHLLSLGAETHRGGTVRLQRLPILTGEDPHPWRHRCHRSVTVGWTGGARSGAERSVMEVRALSEGLEAHGPLRTELEEATGRWAFRRH